MSVESVENIKDFKRTCAIQSAISRKNLVWEFLGVSDTFRVPFRFHIYLSIFSILHPFSSLYHQTLSFSRSYSSYDLASSFNACLLCTYFLSRTFRDEFARCTEIHCLHLSSTFDSTLRYLCRIKINKVNYTRTRLTSGNSFPTQTRTSYRQQSGKVEAKPPPRIARIRCHQLPPQR